MTKNEIPSHASVVVIGGGIMGCSTLYHLSKMGVTDAVLVERNKLTSGTTWHSAAQVRALRNSKNLTRMIQYSVELYSELEKETSQNVGWIQKGSLSIATTPDRLIHIKRQEALAHAYGIQASSISPSAAKERWPLMNSKDVLGAVWSPDDGRVSPSDVCTALSKAAKKLGAKIFEETGVTGILTKNGRVKGIETTNGTIMCNAIALCAGLWSREIGAMVNSKVPVLACEHFYLLTKPINGIFGNMPTLSDHDSHLYIRDDSGGLLIGCFEPMGKPIQPGILDEKFEFSLLPEDWDHFEPMMKLALHRLPQLESAEVKMLLNGPESFTPDGTFMLGETAETRGLFLGCGMNSVGIASGGGAGMNLAHCIIHGHTAYDLCEADAKRFAPVFNKIEHLMARAPEILGNHYDISYQGKQLKTSRNLKRLPLDSYHRKSNAHFGQYYGWERPLYFGKTSEPKLRFDKPDWFDHVGEEVRTTNENVSIFDNSSFGKIEVKGPDAESFLLKVCAGNMDREPGRVIYSAVLNQRGTFESDITAHRIAKDHYRLFVGTTSIQRDLVWFAHGAKGYNITLEDSTSKYAVLAVMGPNSPQILNNCGASTLIELDYFKIGSSHIAGKHIRAARMSYVGELGWEITCKSENAPAIYSALITEGGRPAGIWAQTSMRIEKGYCATGHELDSDISPVEAGLMFAVRKSGGFIGQEALEKKLSEGRVPSIVSLKLHDENAMPLGNEPVYWKKKIIGQTCSCAFGYRVKAPIALARLSFQLIDNSEVEIDIAGDRFKATVVHGPLYDPMGYRMKSFL